MASNRSTRLRNRRMKYNLRKPRNGEQNDNRKTNKSRKTNRNCQPKRAQTKTKTMNVNHKFTKGDKVYIIDPHDNHRVPVYIESLNKNSTYNVGFPISKANLERIYKTDLLSEQEKAEEEYDTKSDTLKSLQTTARTRVEDADYRKWEKSVTDLLSFNGAGTCCKRVSTHRFFSKITFPEPSSYPATSRTVTIRITENRSPKTPPPSIQRPKLLQESDDRSHYPVEVGSKVDLIEPPGSFFFVNIKKQFADRELPYSGKVTGYDAGEDYHWVDFEDGDSEEMVSLEVAKHSGMKSWVVCMNPENATKYKSTIKAKNDNGTYDLLLDDHEFVVKNARPNQFISIDDPKAESVAKELSQDAIDGVSVAGRSNEEDKAPDIANVKYNAEVASPEKKPAKEEASQDVVDGVGATDCLNEEDIIKAESVAMEVSPEMKEPAKDKASQDKVEQLAGTPEKEEAKSKPLAEMSDVKISEMQGVKTVVSTLSKMLMKNPIEHMLQSNRKQEEEQYITKDGDVEISPVDFPQEDPSKDDDSWKSDCSTETEISVQKQADIVAKVVDDAKTAKVVEGDEDVQDVLCALRYEDDSGDFGTWYYVLLADNSQGWARPEQLSKELVYFASFKFPDKELDAIDETWVDRFMSLEEYYDQKAIESGLDKALLADDMPSKFKAFMRQQQEDRKNGKLSRIQINILNSLRFPWESECDKEFDRIINVIYKLYYTKKTYPDDVRKWIEEQKDNYFQLSEDRLEAFKKVGLIDINEEFNPSISSNKRKGRLDDIDDSVFISFKKQKVTKHSKVLGVDPTLGPKSLDDAWETGLACGKDQTEDWEDDESDPQAHVCNIAHLSMKRYREKKESEEKQKEKEDQTELWKTAKLRNHFEKVQSWDETLIDNPERLFSALYIICAQSGYNVAKVTIKTLCADLCTQCGILPESLKAFKEVALCLLDEDFSKKTNYAASSPICCDPENGGGKMLPKELHRYNNCSSDVEMPPEELHQEDPSLDNADRAASSSLFHNRSELEAELRAILARVNYESDNETTVTIRTKLCEKIGVDPSSLSRSQKNTIIQTIKRIIKEAFLEDVLDAIRGKCGFVLTPKEWEAAAEDILEHNRVPITDEQRIFQIDYLQVLYDTPDWFDSSETVAFNRAIRDYRANPRRQSAPSSETSIVPSDAPIEISKQ